MFGFFFKQKTAYEMRISDWSSDVCSSDLPQKAIRLPPAEQPRRGAPRGRTDRAHAVHVALVRRSGATPHGHRRVEQGRGAQQPGASGRLPSARSLSRPWLGEPANPRGRSEEHTSELQSLMRISYAVFCLKKKKTNTVKNK